MNDETALCVTHDEKRDDGFLSTALKDRAEAIITLDRLVREMRGYAGMSIDTRDHEIQSHGSAQRTAS